MIDLSEKFLFMIEPDCMSADEPVRDWATKKMTRLLTAATPGEAYFGWHTCVCGIRSDTSDWITPSGHITNNLAVHYLSRHREDVPASEIEKLRAIVEEI